MIGSLDRARRPWTNEPHCPTVRLVTYWQGVQKRALPAVGVGLISGVVLLFFGDGWHSAVALAVVAFVSAALMPTQSEGRPEPGA